MPRKDGWARRAARHRTALGCRLASRRFRRHRRYARCLCEGATCQRGRGDHLLLRTGQMEEKLSAGSWDGYPGDAPGLALKRSIGLGGSRRWRRIHGGWKLRPNNATTRTSPGSGFVSRSWALRWARICSSSTNWGKPVQLGSGVYRVHVCGSRTADNWSSGIAHQPRRDPLIVLLGPKWVRPALSSKMTK